MSDAPRWVNHHQLQCFRVVAREGSLARAAAVLRVSPQTLSEHVQQLESVLGVTLFRRGARGMSLTDAGREALRCAEGIHALAQEMLGALGGLHDATTPRLRVGVDESLPKVAVWALLRDGARRGARFAVREGAHEDLVALLRARSLDLVLSESAALSSDDERLRCRLLREDPLTWFAEASLAQRLAAGFPESLDAAPVLLAAPGSALRDAAEQWFARRGLRAQVAAEFSDTALAKAACAEGCGLMVLPDAVAEGVRPHGLRAVGPCEGAVQRTFAITPAGLDAHPIVAGLPSAPL